ncbi:MAG: hypothetical protein ACLR6J_20450 [Parabacteroides merdae]
MALPVKHVKRSVLCEAARFDAVFVETVGVGQSETAVHSMVDFFLLIQLAGTGDELQGIKRGIMEMADGIIINKADGDNLEKSKTGSGAIPQRLAPVSGPESGWSPKVLTYSGYYNLGIKEIWDMVGEYMEFTQRTATSTTSATNKPNIGCTKVSTTHSAKRSTTIRR